MKKLLALSFIFALIGVSTNLFAVDNAGGTTTGEIVKSGTTGANFLKIDVGARGIAMGAAYGSVTNDMTSIYWNAAGMADVDKMSVNASYSDWFGNISHSFLGVGMPVGDGYTIGLGFISYGAGDIPVTTMNEPEGTGATYNINDMMFSGTFAGYLTNQFSFGVTAKYLYSSFADVTANGVAFDIGTMYDTEIYGVKLGFTIQNLGLEQKYSGQDLSTLVTMHEGFYESPVDAEYVSYNFSTPLTFRASISSDLSEEVFADPENNNLIVATDFLTVSDQKEQFLVGAEYTWNNLLSIRSGYRFGHDQFSYSGGIGLKYDGNGFGGKIDYAICPTKTMGMLNRISVSLNFGY